MALPIIFYLSVQMSPWYISPFFYNWQLDSYRITVVLFNPSGSPGTTVYGGLRIVKSFDVLSCLSCFCTLIFSLGIFRFLFATAM